MPEPNCVEMLLDEIDRALKAELYVVATMAALTLPDMCAAVVKGDGRKMETFLIQGGRNEAAKTVHHARTSGSGVYRDIMYD